MSLFILLLFSFFMGRSAPFKWRSNIVQYRESILLNHPRRVERSEVYSRIKLNERHQQDRGNQNIRSGSMIEYTSAKGSKRLALVVGRSDNVLDVLNEARKPFTVTCNRVTYHISGNFEFGDLLRLNEIVMEIRQTLAS